MTRTRIKPPMCMGQRMSGEPARWFLKLEALGLKVTVQPFAAGKVDWSVSTLDTVRVYYHESDVASGVQAAANAAERWLVKRAELTLKLAGRRAGA